MPPLPQPRHGVRLLVKKRPVPFSYWPSRQGRRHHALQSLLFALNPWAVIERAITKSCPKSRQSEALACLEQAQDFHTAATQAGIMAARPLALYYSFMNLAKAYCLTRGSRETFDQAQHGLSERRRPGKKQELIHAYLEAWPTPNLKGEPNVFAEFMQVLTGVALPLKTEYDLPVLIPQILPGHRMWAMAAKKTERFIAAYDIQFWNDPTTQQLWLRIYFVAHDLTRLGVTHQRMLKESRLGPEFLQVECLEQHNGQPLLCFEQTQPVASTDHPADQLLALLAQVRNRIWLTVTSNPPYRRPYVYLVPSVEAPFVLPQLLSIYAVTYYLGSVTRYRPHHYDAIVKGPFGPRIEEFVSGQTLQFIYLLASEFALQDVTQPSIL